MARSSAVSIKGSNSGGKIISFLLVLIGHLDPPPILFCADSQGKDKAAQSIGQGIEHVRIPPWHEILMDLIGDTVEKGNKKRDEDRMKIDPGFLQGKIYQRGKQPVCQQMNQLISKGEGRGFYGRGK